MCKDTGKPPEEMRLSEVTQTLCAARHMVRSLRGWMADERFASWGILFPSTPTIRHEPHGALLALRRALARARGGPCRSRESAERLFSLIVKLLGLKLSAALPGNNAVLAAPSVERPPS